MANDTSQTSLVSMRGLAHQVLTALERHELPPTPENYRLWYAHLSRERPELSRLLGVLLSQGHGISEERCAELYERFFGGSAEEERAHQACQRLVELTRSLGEHVEALLRETTRYGSCLDDAEQVLRPHGEPAALLGLLRKLGEETRAMGAQAELLERHLRESRERVAALRRDLELAWREARTDGLTGLANRKRFEAELRAAAALAVERNVPVCLMLADIDHFKQFNDRYGHWTGDQALRAVATVLKRQVKGQDLVARLGGEEFAVILPNTRLHDAFALADRIRTAIGSRQIRVKEDGASLGRITLSAGVTDYQPGERLKRWCERADEALYAAKAAGRNRVVATAAAATSTPQRQPAHA